MIGVVALLGSPGSPVRAQDPITQVRHSTYDFTDKTPNLDLVETWVDCKTPGNGWTYSVGTIEIQNTLSQFSDFAAFPARGCPPIQTLDPGVPKKRIVMLQAVGPDPVTGEDQAILWQRFYYGNQLTYTSSRYTNARAISVWPVLGQDGNLDDVNTRIAICGETIEDQLPLQEPPVAGGLENKGFIAIFNGAGEHLWSYQFFGAQFAYSPPTVPVVIVNASDTGVTDVSIRVEGGYDVVTYCGVSQVGVPPFGTLKPIKPFAAPISSCATATGGVAVGTGGTGGPYDGFVGRLRQVHGSAVPPPLDPEFHSLVGGDGNDGLFAIDEIDANRFVVCGFADGRASAHTFPFTSTCVTQPTGAPSLGVVMAFDASQVASGGALQLEWSQHLGDATAIATSFGHTIARDVIVKRDQNGTGETLILAVGSTDDPDMFAYVRPLPGGGYGPPSYFVDVHHGGRDGFLASLRETSSTVSFETGTFHGTTGDEDFRGIGGWSEFSNGFTVLGSIGAWPAMDIEVVDYQLEVGYVPVVRHDVRLDEVLSSPSHGYQPARTGVSRVDFIDEQGGGIAVDEKGRVTVVGGMTDPMPPATAIYPETTGAMGTYTPNMKDGRAWNNPLEAYRVVLDMLPAGTGRTDGTGVSVPGGGAQFPLPGYFGGTTPECGLVPYGMRIGGPTPSVRRMCIDANARDSSGNLVDPAPGSTLSVVVDYPPLGALDLVAWQLGFPGSGLGVGAPLPLGGTWIWTPESPVVQAVFPPVGAAEATWVLPPGGGTFTVQLVYLSTSGVIPCTGESYVASSALWVSY